MKFEFIDTNNIRYQFRFNVEPGISEPHIEITVYRSATGSSSTLRPIVNKKVKWWDPDDEYKVSKEARYYIDKIIKNLAFC